MMRSRLPSPNRSAYCGVSLQALCQMSCCFHIAFVALGVLQPVARGAGEVDDDEVGPAVAVEVFGPAGEAMAVGAVAVVVVAEFADRVHLPVGRLVPRLAVEDVHLAVLVHVGDGDAFGAEDLVQDGLLPGDVGGGDGGRDGVGGGQAERTASSGAVSTAAASQVRRRMRLPRSKEQGRS